MIIPEDHQNDFFSRVYSNNFEIIIIQYDVIVKLAYRANHGEDNIITARNSRLDAARGCWTNEDADSTVRRATTADVDISLTQR